MRQRLLMGAVPFALAATLVLAVPASAATNLVPNPGFETGPCAIMPCDWAQVSSTDAGAEWSAFDFHSGEASLHFFSSGAAGSVQADSSCFSVPVDADYDASFWARDYASPHEAVMFMTVSYFDNLTCAAPATLQEGFIAGVSDSWEQKTSSTPLHPPSGTQTALVSLQESCVPVFPFVCESGFDTYVDDVVFAEQEPTAVAVSMFTASRSRGSIVLAWRTASESETIGFNLYRQRQGKLVKLNRALIPSQLGGMPTGHRYSWLDRRAPKGSGTLRYRLQAVSLDGTRRWVGSASVA